MPHYWSDGSFLDIPPHRLGKIDYSPRPARENHVELISECFKFSGQDLSQSGKQRLQLYGRRCTLPPVVA
eukprot:3146232-Pyramimonas_sp.AAC.1